MTDTVRDTGRSEGKTRAPFLPCGAPPPVGESPSRRVSPGAGGAGAVEPTRRSDPGGRSGKGQLSGIKGKQRDYFVAETMLSAFP